MRVRPRRALVLRMRTALLLALPLLPACMYRSTTIERGDPGQEITLVTRGEGTTIGYVADRATETCWFVYGEQLGNMHCCDMRKFKKATSVITWESDETCAARDRARAAALASELEVATPVPAPASVKRAR
jgi:hypothetical protein